MEYVDGVNKHIMREMIYEMIGCIKSKKIEVEYGKYYRFERLNNQIVLKKKEKYSLVILLYVFMRLDIVLKRIIDILVRCISYMNSFTNNLTKRND
jgi:hypothetical protein